MQKDLQVSEVKRGMKIWFFMHPKDSIPTIETTVIGVEEDFRGRASIMAKGIGEEYPIYHFKLPRPQPQSYASTIPIQECDDLYKRLGI